MRSDLRRRWAPIGLALALALPGCAVFRTPPPLTAETAYQRGMAAYAERRWTRAAELLQSWADVSPGDPRLSEGLYALGTARMESREYILAATTLLRVVTEFPTGPRQEDARFALCDAYHRLSPQPALDQTDTRTALLYCSSYIEYFPQAARTDRARLWIDEMRVKLARKSYDAGLWYFRRGAYDASVIYFAQAATEFPQTPVAPAALLRTAEAYDRIGYKEEAEEARTRLRTTYPRSTEALSLPAAVAPAPAATPAAAPATPAVPPA
ncbi:MAG TPA: outer membrane protein assembly factor BamD [Longimicrobium sp.]|nr:outer membrane protein assembly factor BamD [Longimicrobium sp.]